MADIKNYLKEREKREKSQAGYKEKIRKHRLAGVLKLMLVVLTLVVVAVLIIVQYKQHVYTGYEVVSSVARESLLEAADMRLDDSILTYSKDGAHCMDTKGNVKWNQTYQIQDIRIAVCHDVVAIGNYNGREIYVQNTQKQLGVINTTMPIRNLTVSASGYVTAVLADTDAAWINTYNLEGELIYEGQAHMHDSGYPAAVSLSPNGELLAVSYVYVDAGTIKTDVAFYNFGPVGANQSDNLVSVYSYSDLLVPELNFMNDETAFAVGDSRLMIYKNGQKPVTEAEHLFSQEIQSVYFNEEYIGLVFVSDEAEYGYKMEIYNTKGQKQESCYFDLEYMDIFFGDENITIYNETECLVMTYGGDVKYNGVFSKAVKLMLPTGTPYKYLLVTEGSIDTIQLK